MSSLSLTIRSLRRLIAVFFVFGVTTQISFAEEKISVPQNRQIYLIEAVEGYVVLTYLFSIDNLEKNPKKMRFALTFPHEVEDWVAQEGLAKEDINLGAEGGVFIDKTFPPGSHFAALGLKIPAYGGMATLTFGPTSELGEVLVLARPGQYELKSDFLSFEASKSLMGEKYDALTRESVPAGSTFTVSIAGIPQGRQRLWYLGGVFALCLLTLAVSTFWLTKH